MVYRLRHPQHASAFTPRPLPPLPHCPSRCFCCNRTTGTDTAPLPPPLPLLTGGTRTRTSTGSSATTITITTTPRETTLVWTRCEGSLYSCGGGTRAVLYSLLGGVLVRGEDRRRTRRGRNWMCFFMRRCARRLSLQACCVCLRYSISHGLFCIRLYGWQGSRGVGYAI